MSNKVYSVDFVAKDKLSDTIDKVKRGLDGVSTSSDKLDKINEKFNKIQNSAQSYQRKIREINDLMAKMNMDGLGGTDMYNQLATQAASYTDAIGDARQATRLLSSDTAGLQAGVQAFTAFTAAANIAVGTMGLLGVQNDDVKEKILKVQSAMALLNGVQTISNALNKDSVLVLKAKQTWHNLVTAAQVANTAATGVNSASISANTVVTLANNVAKAIAKALFGDFTGLLLVGAGALAAYSLTLSDNTDAQKKNNEAKEAANKKIESEAGAIANVVSKYTALGLQYRALKNSMEKKQFIKDHASEINSLGINIKTVNDAENAFILNTDKYVRALQARAGEAALYDQLREAYLKYYAALKKNKSGLGDPESANYEPDHKKRSQIIKDIHVQRRNLEEAKKYFILELTKLREEQADVFKQDTGSKSGEGFIDPKDLGNQFVNLMLQAAEEYQNQASKIQKAFSMKIISKEEALTAFKQLREAAGKDGLNTDALKLQLDLSPTGLDRLKAELKTMEDELRATEIDLYDSNFDWSKVYDLLNRIADKKQEIEQWEFAINIKPFKTGIDSLRAEMELAKKQLTSIDLTDIEGIKKLRTLINNLQKEIDEEELRLGIKVPDEEIDKIETISSSLGQIRSATTWISGIGDAFENCKTGLDYFTTGLDQAIGALEAINGTIQTVNTLTKLKEQIDTHAAQKAIANSTLEVAAEGTKTLAKEATAAASVKAAAAEFFQAHAWIPYVGAAIAGGLIGVMLAVMAKFETGGIVGGTSYSGDKQTVRVNSGEMILNQRQQSRLWNMINDNSTAGTDGVVRFYISGDQLAGVLRNNSIRNDELF